LGQLVAVDPANPLAVHIKSWGDLEPYFTNLESRLVTSVNDLERMIRDLENLKIVFDENETLALLAFARNGNDCEAARIKNLFVNEIDGKFKEACAKIEKKIFMSPFFSQLPDATFGRYKERLSHSLPFSTNPNITALEPTLEGLYDQAASIIAGIKADLGGQQVTLTQAQADLQSPDPEKRKTAWLAINAAMATRPAPTEAEPNPQSPAEKLHDLYNQTITISEQLAKTAGCTNFEDYVQQRYLYEYPTGYSQDFDEAVKAHASPLLRQLHQDRQQLLGLNEIHAWDYLAPPTDGTSLTVYDSKDPMVARTFAERMGTIFSSLGHPALATIWTDMAQGLTDIGPAAAGVKKRTGATAYMLLGSARTFLFVNGNGQWTDARSTAHEFGHAVHAAFMRGIPSFTGRSPQYSLAELGSQSMELLAMDAWDENALFATDADRIFAQHEQLEGVVSRLCEMAAYDTYEHWIHQNSSATQDQKDTQFLMITKEFGLHDVEVTDGWRDNPELQGLLAKRDRNRLMYSANTYQLRISPLYGVGQLQAARVYQRYFEFADKQKVLDDFLSGLALGNTVSPKEVFARMGISAEFSAEDVVATMTFMGQQIAATRPQE
jgi:oligoendopeptidase F